MWGRRAAARDAPVPHELSVVLRFEVEPGADPGSAVRGEVRSPYGRRPFWGWLELMGELEALIDRAAGEADPGAG